MDRAFGLFADYSDPACTIGLDAWRSPLGLQFNGNKKERSIHLSFEYIYDNQFIHLSDKDRPITLAQIANPLTVRTHAATLGAHHLLALGDATQFWTEYELAQ